LSELEPVAGAFADDNDGESSKPKVVKDHSDKDKADTKDRKKGKGKHKHKHTSADNHDGHEQGEGNKQGVG
jgi:hypothetical protein